MQQGSQNGYRYCPYDFSVYIRVCKVFVTRGRGEGWMEGRMEGWMEGGRMEGWMDKWGWRKKHNLTECATEEAQSNRMWDSHGFGNREIDGYG